MAKKIPYIPQDEEILTLEQGKKAYFVSDLHLGAAALNNNVERERKVIAWLEEIKQDCGVLFLMGDIFDFWFEYKLVVPKGHVRFLAKLCEYRALGIQVHFFCGNHDFGVLDYLKSECDIEVHRNNRIFVINDKRYFLGHGDALNPNDKGYIFMYKIFQHWLCQAMFRFIHPDIGMWLAYRWSSHSRLSGSKEVKRNEYIDESKEEIIYFCKNTLETQHFDFFIFGHRHKPMDITLNESSRYLNTGDWISYYTYVVASDTSTELCYL